MKRFPKVGDEIGLTIYIGVGRKTTTKAQVAPLYTLCVRPQGSGPVPSPSMWLPWHEE